MTRPYGCRLLLAAMLLQADLDIKEACKTGWRSRKAAAALLAAEQAASWIAAKSEEPFGFGWVCEHLGLCPARTARELLPPEARRRLRALTLRVRAQAA